MKSKASTGTAREGREKQGGPAAGRRLCFHLTHGPLRFMTFSTCRSLDERHERKGGRAAECGGLENRFTGNPGDEGSNPSSSARKLEALANAGAFSFSGQLR